MSQPMEVLVEQIGPTTSRGSARSHTVLVDRPMEKGGSDRGALGGELFLLSLGGCFMSNLLAAARGRNADLVDARVAVSGTTEGSPSRFSSITLRVGAPTSDPELLRKLVTIAEHTCIVTNTLKPSVAISLIVDESVSAAGSR